MWGKLLQLCCGRHTRSSSPHMTSPRTNESCLTHELATCVAADIHAHLIYLTCAHLVYITHAHLKSITHAHLKQITHAHPQNKGRHMGRNGACCGRHIHTLHIYHARTHGINHTCTFRNPENKNLSLAKKDKPRLRCHGGDLLFCIQNPTLSVGGVCEYFDET